MTRMVRYFSSWYKLQFYELPRTKCKPIITWNASHHNHRLDRSRYYGKNENISFSSSPLSSSSSASASASSSLNIPFNSIYDNNNNIINNINNINKTSSLLYKQSRAMVSSHARHSETPNNGGRAKDSNSGGIGVGADGSTSSSTSSGSSGSTGSSGTNTGIGINHNSNRTIKNSDFGIDNNIPSNQSSFWSWIQFSQKWGRYRGLWKSYRDNRMLISSRQQPLSDEDEFNKLLGNWGDSLLSEPWKEFVKNILIPLGNASLDNKIEVYHNGDSFFRNLWDDIENAQSQIMFETYIMEPDGVGLRTIELLTQACQRGVSVTLIIDGFGGSDMTASHFTELQKAGGVVLFYNPVHVLRIFNKIINFESPMFLAYRNHKKCVVIDGEIGYTGGMNIGGEYCSSAISGGINKFRDTHCRLQGPAVELLQDAIYYSIIDIDPQIPVDDLVEEVESKEGSTKNTSVITTRRFTGRFFPSHMLQFLHRNKIKRSILAAQKQATILTDQSTTTIPTNDEDNYSTPLLSRWQQWNQRNNAMNGNRFTMMPSILRSRYDNSKERFQNWLQRDRKVQWQLDEDVEQIGQQTNLKTLSKVVQQAKASMFGDTEGKEEEEEKEERGVGGKEGEEKEEQNKTNVTSKVIGIDVDLSDSNNPKVNTIIDVNINEKKKAGDTYIQVLESYREIKMRNIQNALQSAINYSKSHVFVMNPYFLPPRKLKRVLINASLRNVDVWIITCDQSDVWMVSMASRHIYEELLQHPRIRLFEYGKKVLHGKMVLIDDVFVSIGSFNFDDWSHARNLEMNLMIVDPKCGKNIREQFMIDLKDCKEIKLEQVRNRHWYQKWLYWLAYTGSRIADKIF